jgi:DNA replication protein DnaC
MAEEIEKAIIALRYKTTEQWDKIFFDAVVANAILDRILHHAHIITITGKSYRLKDCLFNKE